MDFNKIIESTDRYNFHSHTQFCDGRAPMEEFVAAAVDNGFLHYGFSPHSPVPIASPCNMDRDKVKEYLDEINRLREIYAGRINLYAAMEVDYLGKEWGPANSYFRSLPLDYTIGSVHFIPTQDGAMIDIDGHADRFIRYMKEYFHDDIRYVVNTFYDQSLKMVEEGGFDIIGHYDKIGHNASHYCPGIESETWYRKKIDELTDAVIESGIAVEINTKARAEHNRFFPATDHWATLKKAGVTIIVNSDAHYPDLIDASRSEALRLLGEIK